jgi:hypothetical protein
MTVLVGVETLLLVLLTLLVIGLLRSHAEILRRLDEVGDGASVPAAGHHDPRPAPIASSDGRAADVVGETLDGEPVKVAVVGARRPTLLAFLSSGCLSCEGIWGALRSGGARGLPGDARAVVVVKDADQESPARLHELAPADETVVMASAAWEDYRVAGSPYFILVEPDGTVAGEGSAGGWDQLVSLVRDAVGDAGGWPSPAGSRESVGGHSQRGMARLARADAELDGAGIGPGHPSLYSTGTDEDGSEKSSA